MTDQQRCISEEDSALGCGGDGLGHFSLLIRAGRLCPGWEGPRAVPGTGPLPLCRIHMAYGGSSLVVGCLFHHSPLLLNSEKAVVAVSWT